MVTSTRHRGELAISLIERVGAIAHGTTVMVPVSHPDEVAVIDDWCGRTGNSVLAVSDSAVEVYRGRLSDPSSSVAADRMPGRRLWMYTNFHCNLACDYCCVSSSPTTAPRSLTADMVRQAVTEGVAAGVSELYLTGGEPFMNAEIGAIVDICAQAAPTVMLTNGMLFRGSRLEILKTMPRSGLTLQISVDSPTPEHHDLHRGAGSWQRAINGVVIAKKLGIDVRLAASLTSDAPREERALEELCERLGLASKDTVVRRIALQGEATRGIVISRATVVPEVCLTTDGIYWHPVAATDPSMLVTKEISPLADAIDLVRSEFLEYRRTGDILAATFPCA